MNNVSLRDLLYEKKINKIMKEIDSVPLSELQQFIDTDRVIFETKYKPAVRNILRKVMKRMYEGSHGSRIFRNVVDEGAKKYVAEFGLKGTWNEVFNKSQRDKLAEMYAKTVYEALNMKHPLVLEQDGTITHDAKLSFSHIKSVGNKLYYYFKYDKSTQNLIIQSLSKGNKNVTADLKGITKALNATGIRAVDSEAEDIGSFEIFHSVTKNPTVNSSQLRSLFAMMNIPVKLFVSSGESAPEMDVEEPDIPETPEAPEPQVPEVPRTPKVQAPAPSKEPVAEAGGNIKDLGLANDWQRTDPRWKKVSNCQKMGHKIESNQLGNEYFEYTCPQDRIKWRVDSSD